jgi:hypothetical protein
MADNHAAGDGASVAAISPLKLIAALLIGEKHEFHRICVEGLGAIVSRAFSVGKGWVPTSTAGPRGLCDAH